MRTTLICVFLASTLGIACGRAENHKAPDTVAVEPAPEPTSTPEPEPLPAPSPDPAPRPSPLPSPVPTETPAPAILPPARTLTEGERKEFLTTDDSIIIPPSSVTSLGNGFDSKTRTWRHNQCLILPSAVESSLPKPLTATHFAILPLTSNKQLKDLFQIDGHILDDDRELDGDSELTVIAIAIQAKSKVQGEGFVRNPKSRNWDVNEWMQFCGDHYKKGFINGRYLLSHITFEVHSASEREKLLSRLIDSGQLGQFQDAEAFARSLHDLSTRMTASTLSVKSLGRTAVGGLAQSFWFDFSDEVTDWLKAGESIEATAIPEIAPILEKYPG